MFDFHTVLSIVALAVALAALLVTILVTRQQGREYREYHDHFLRSRQEFSNQTWQSTETVVEEDPLPRKKKSAVKPRRPRKSPAKPGAWDRLKKADDQDGWENAKDLMFAASREGAMQDPTWPVEEDINKDDSK